MKTLYGVIAFIVLVVIAAFVVPSFINWNSYKPEITERIEALTGRQLSIDGDIDIALLPSPKLRISDARLSNLAGAQIADMARLQALDLRLALGPLISGDIQVSSLTLIDPVIELERLADGRVNWLFAPPPGDTAETGDRGGDGGASGDAADEDATAISLDSVSIQNGTIVYRDSAADSVEYFQHLNGTLSAKSLDGPFRGDGTLDVRGLETSFQIAGGRKREDGHMPVSIKIELGEDLAQLGFDGKIFARDTGSDGSGTLRVSGPDLAALAEAMGVGSAQSFASDKFSLKAEAVLSETGLTLDELQIRLGETQANGTIAYLTGTPARLDATLKINRFDLDKITQNGAADRGAADTKQQVPGEAGTASSESSKPGGARDAAPETGVDVYLAMLPADLAASIDLEVQTLRYLGGVVQQAHAVLSLDEGVITIQQATALLPGGSNVALFGQISPSEGGARFDGQVEMASDDVRAVISWLNLLDASDLPADRLRRFSLTAGLSTDATGGELSALDLRIDASRLQGYANFALGTRNILDANLHLDRLNADAYLAAATTSEQGDATPDAGTETAAQPTGGGEASAPSAASEGNGLALLDTLDATLKLTVGRLSYGGAILSGVTLESVLKDKTLTVQRLEVSDLSGARLAINGEIRDPAGEPDITLNFGAKAESILGLIRVAGITPNFSTDNLGAVSLLGVISGGRDSVNLNARLDTRPADLLLIGSIATPLDNAVLNLALELRAPDTAELLRAADMTPPKLAHRLGALALDGGLDGSLEALNISLSARAAGNHLQVAGTLADFSTGGQGGQYDLAFDLANSSFATLAELLSGTAYEGKDAGAVRITGQLAGDGHAASISDLSLAIGKTHIAGAAEIILSGPVPILRAALQAGLLDAGLFIGGATATATATTEQAEAAESAGGATAASGSNSATQNETPPEQRQVGQWSREPFDLSPLAEIEADISVVAEAILAGGYRFDQAELKFRITGGALEIDSLRGRLFDGLLEAEGRIADAQPPQASLTFKLDGIDMAQALREAAQTEAVTGRASIDGRFTSAGYSEYDLVRAVQGDATLHAGNGTVEGLDLRVLSDRLGELNNPADFLGLADSGLSGGTTRLDSLDGTIQVRNGLATTHDLVVLADGGRGDIRGTADLPSWQLDLTALFDLTDHPKAPPVGVRMTGAIDNPARELLISEMQAYLIKHIAKTSIGKLIVPKLRKGAKAEPGSIEDTLLRGIFGDPDDDAPATTQPPAELSAPALAPQTGSSETTGLAPQKDSSEQVGLAPQQGESRTERAPAPAPSPEPAPAPQRAKDDPLSPADILQEVFDIIGD